MQVLVVALNHVVLERTPEAGHEPGRQVVEEDHAAVAAHVVRLHAPAAPLPGRVYTRHLQCAAATAKLCRELLS